MSVRSKLWICAAGLLACSLPAARAEVVWNGINLNGLRFNRIELNGLGMNGIHFNGLVYNGLELKAAVGDPLPVGPFAPEVRGSGAPDRPAPDRPAFELTVDKGRLLLRPRHEGD